MQATDCTRDDCQLGQHRLTYHRMIARYVCSECGGLLTIRFGPDWYICCAACGGYDFITETQFTNQCVDAYVIKQGLPDHLLALVQPERERVTPQQAISELFDTGE